MNEKLRFKVGEDGYQKLSRLLREVGTKITVLTASQSLAMSLGTNPALQFTALRLPHFLSPGPCNNVCKCICHSEVCISSPSSSFSSSVFYDIKDGRVSKVPHRLSCGRSRSEAVCLFELVVSVLAVLFLNK